MELYLCNDSKERIVTTSNATMGLIQVLRYWTCTSNTTKKQYVICPSWTFVATVSAIVNSGITPYLVDVEPDTEIPNLEKMELEIDAIRNGNGGEVLGVVLTLPFGCPIDLLAVVKFAKKNKVKILIDAAAGLDAIKSEMSRSPDLFEDLTVVISLHATKAFGIGEGAVIICSSKEDYVAISSLGNFGFVGSRDSKLPGLNSKLSEYSAAIGLGMLDSISEIRDEWLEVRKAFRSVALTRPYVKKTPQLLENYVSSYGNVRFDQTMLDTRTAELKLFQKGIESRRWWGAGVHRQTYYRDALLRGEISEDRSFFENTDQIARESIGLPFFCGLSMNSIEQIFSILDDLAFE
jgi:dTDP-4-amino-4,6-dideoxygalactose transaminase